MPEITPFKAVRPTRDKVSLVTSRPYEEYSASELAFQLDYNPMSFLHILNPAYSNQHTTDYETRFRQVFRKYDEFKQEEILVQDNKPSFYIHRISTGEHNFIGIIAGLSVMDYKSDVIKRHEDTISYRVELFKEYIKHSSFNTEPVLVTYPDNPLLKKWLEDKMTAAPEYEFSTTKKEIHYLWKIDSNEDIAALQGFFSDVDCLYIADGHHRSASAEMLFDEDGSQIGQSKNHFMSFLIADCNIRIYSFNRLARDLNGLSEAEFIRRLSADFLIEAKDILTFVPQDKHHFGMYLARNYYLLTLKNTVAIGDNPLEHLDSHILYTKVIENILEISDLRNDDRIEYISGKCPVEEVIAKVDSGAFAVGFILFAATMEDVKSIADAKLIMPPKSTYIEPKLRTGLVIYEMD